MRDTIQGTTTWFLNGVSNSNSKSKHQYTSRLYVSTAHSSNYTPGKNIETHIDPTKNKKKRHPKKKGSDSNLQPLRFKGWDIDFNSQWTVSLLWAMHPVNWSCVPRLCVDLQQETFSVPGLAWLISFFGSRNAMFRGCKLQITKQKKTKHHFKDDSNHKMIALIVVPASGCPCVSS